MQRLLDRSGWAGWTTWLRLDVAGGPCGSVSGLGGGGRPSISGALDERGRRVMVFGALPRSTEDLLYGPGKLVPALQDESGRRCYGPTELAGQVRRMVAAAAPGWSVAVEHHLQGGLDLLDARGARFEAGCAVVDSVAPAADGRRLVVTIARKG